MDPEDRADIGLNASLRRKVHNDHQTQIPPEMELLAVGYEPCEGRGRPSRVDQTMHRTKRRGMAQSDIVVIVRDWTGRKVNG